MNCWKQKFCKGLPKKLISFLLKNKRATFHTQTTHSLKGAFSSAQVSVTHVTFSDIIPLQDTSDSHSLPLVAPKWRQPRRARGRPTGGPPSALQTWAPSALCARLQAPPGLRRLPDHGRDPLAPAPLLLPLRVPSPRQSSDSRVALIVGRVCHFVGWVTRMDGLDTPSSLLEEKKKKKRKVRICIDSGRDSPGALRAYAAGWGKAQLPLPHSFLPALKKNNAQRK